MDAIESLDWGVYSHFDFQDQKYLFIKPFMETAYYASSYYYVGASVLAALAVGLFLMQGRRRAGIVCVLSFAASILLIEAVHWLVPRRRPENGAKVVGADHMLGSYPATGVFLFLLAMILIGFALWNVTRPWQRIGYIVIAAGLTVWVCMSQFFLSTHFLTDILGGLAGATFVGWIAGRLLRESQPLAPGAARTELPTTDFKIGHG